MHVLHRIDSLRLADGGVVRALLDLAAALSTAGARVTIAVRESGDAPAAWLQPGANPRVVEVSGPASPELARMIAEADVIHLHGMWNPADLKVAKAARAAGKPYVVSPHGMLDPWPMQQKALKKRAYLALAGSRWLAGASAVHFTASEERASSLRWLPRRVGGRGREQASCAVPLVFQLGEYRELPGAGLARERFGVFRSGMPVVLFLSRLHEKKGVEFVIDAVARLREAGRPHALAIAGPGDEGYVASLRARVERLGLGATTEFLGLVSGPLKVSCYQASDVLAIPSSQENFGYVFYEALACGTPVVTTRFVDTWRELESTGAAAVVEQSAAGVASGIERFTGEGTSAHAGRDACGLTALGLTESGLTESGLTESGLTELGQRSRAWIFEHLSEAGVAQRFMEMYAAVRSGLPVGAGGA